MEPKPIFDIDFHNRLLRDPSVKRQKIRCDLFEKLCKLEILFQELHPKEIQLFLKMNSKKININEPPYFRGEFICYFIQLFEELLKDSEYKKHFDHLMTLDHEFPEYEYAF